MRCSRLVGLFLVSGLALTPALTHAAPPSPLDAAAGVMNALQGRSAARLGHVVSFPFVFDASQPCGGPRADQRELVAFVQCLRARFPALPKGLTTRNARPELTVAKPTQIESPELRARVETFLRGLESRSDLILVRAVVEGTPRFELVFVVDRKSALVLALLVDADALV